MGIGSSPCRQAFHGQQIVVPLVLPPTAGLLPREAPLLLLDLATKTFMHAGAGRGAYPHCCQTQSDHVTLTNQV